MKQTARGLLRILRPYDYLIIFLLIVGSFLPLVLFQTQAQSQTGDRYAVIRINGQEVDRFNLDALSTLEKTYYPAQGQYNIIEIDDGRIRVKEDNSPDQIAVKTGWISKNGQTSICLPHKLVIEINQSGAEDYFIY
ncbi:NusG domain II-containing protein [Enterococcus sp. N249-2]